MLVFEWFKRFQVGEQDVEDENIGKISSLIRYDRWLTSRAVAVGVTKVCVKQTLYNSLI